MGERPSILRERLYIPRDQVDSEAIQKKYQRKIYEESACERCNLRLERFDPLHCAPCPAYKGEVRMWREATLESQDYLAIPAGNLKKAAKKFGISEIKDERTQVPFVTDLKFTGKLYEGETHEGIIRPNQKKLVQEWLKSGSGLIEAPPRTGKTVIGVYLACHLRQRTLIVASQNLWLRQFARTFKNLTNASEIKERIGHFPFIVLQERAEISRIKDRDIVLLTYQKFITEAQQPDFQKYLANNFGLLICDEAHQGNAFAFSRFLGNINSRYKLGLTATPKRVDGMHFIVKEILGPVKTRSNTTALLPKLKLWESGIGGKDWKTWYRMENFIYSSRERNVQIVRQIFKDLRRNPKNSILIPVARIKHMHELVEMINKQADYNRKHRQENWPEHLAQPFWSGMNRKKTLQRISTFGSRVTVAIARMVQMGLDIPEWSHVYIGVKPMSSPPMFYQLANRCCTPAAWEKKPIVRIMVDSNRMSRGCLRKLLLNEIRPHLAGKDVRYLCSDRTQALIKKVLQKNSSGNF